MNRLRREGRAGTTSPAVVLSGFIFLAFVFLFPIVANAQGAFYAEEIKDGRIYVFNDPRQYEIFKQTGELEVRISRIGAGPNGETLYFDSENAIHLYNFKHDLPAEVILKAETSAPTWQEKLPFKLSGYMFGDYFYNLQRDDDIANLSNVALGGPEEFNGFLLRRIYFSYDDDISKDFAVRFRLEADSVSLDSRGKITVFVKDAYLRWKNLGKNEFIFGIQPPPAYEVSEAAWAYRSLEKTIMDLRGIVSSRDIGVSLKGKLDGSGKYGYWVMFGNGSGNNPETDKFKRLYGHFEWRPTEKFVATIYQDYRALPDIADPNDPSIFVDNSSYTTAWFAGYGVKDRYNIGYEGFLTRQENGVRISAAPTAALDDRKALGHSFWAWYNFTPKIGVVGRYDYLEPNNHDTSQGDKRNLFIGSVVFKPHKNVWIMPNIYVESYEDIAGNSVKTSITPRVTMYYIFL